MTTLRAATRDDEDALAALWRECFDAPVMLPQWRLDSDRHAHTIVADDAGDLLGSIYMLRTALRTRSATADVLGLANVAVSTRARGHGLATLLVDAAVRAGRQGGADFALLFTGAPGVYGGNGFMGFPQRRRAVGALRHRGAAGADSTVRIAVSPVDDQAVEGLGALHDAATSTRPLSAIRSPLGWRRARWWFDDGLVYRAYRERTVVAYLVARMRGAGREMGGSDAAVLEAGCLPGDDATLVALAERVRSDARRAGCEIVELDLPRGDPFDVVVDALCVSAERPIDETAMFLPLAASEAATAATCRDREAHHWTGDYV